MNRIAKCCCESCTIEVTGEPYVNGVCHCANCKRRTGSAFSWGVYFQPEQIVRKEGNFILYPIESAHQERWFCAKCGTTMWWQVKLNGVHTGIAAGCFGIQSLGEPVMTVNNEGRCSWVGLPDTWITSVEAAAASVLAPDAEAPDS